MKEINVVVKQQPGKVSWNFEEIKAKLAEELQVFKNTVYTDDTIKSAKTDVASLRKLKSEIEARRKEVKDKCLEPYSIIEGQAKELTQLIDEPIEAIAAQVDDYERRRKEIVKAKIEEFWQKEAEALPDDIRDAARQKIYDSRWENATTAMKTWKDGIQKGVQGICIDIQTIADFHSDFEEDMMAAYKKNLELREAIGKMNDLEAQRRRLEEIERRKHEEAEERARIEAEKAARLAAEKEAAEKEAEEAERADTNVLKEEQPEQPSEAANQPQTAKTQYVPPVLEEMKQEPVEEAQPAAIKEVITIFGTVEQIEKIKKFIVYAGAEWQEGAVNDAFDR